MLLRAIKIHFPGILFDEKPKIVFSIFDRVFASTIFRAKSPQIRSHLSLFRLQSIIDILFAVLLTKSKLWSRTKKKRIDEDHFFSLFCLTNIKAICELNAIYSIDELDNWKRGKKLQQIHNKKKRTKNSFWNTSSGAHRKCVYFKKLIPLVFESEPFRFIGHFIIMNVIFSGITYIFTLRWVEKYRVNPYGTKQPHA